MEDQTWFKVKGYLHLSSKVQRNRFKSLIKRIENPDYVSKFAFYPLLHVQIKERRYKKVNGKRTHSFKNDAGEVESTAKIRPIHYANHVDSLIFGYYASLLQTHYEKYLEENPELSDTITAYRRIPQEETDKNKSTIHFAKDVFDEIKKRSLFQNDVVVLAFDIKSFFSSLDHQILYKKWAELINKTKLPSDHFNVYKAATRFSFIYKDDLRRFKSKYGRRKGFDEKQLAEIRNNYGIFSFFSNPSEFREAVHSGKIRVYKNPFKNKEGKSMGIPQGLPISAVLANLYLLEFDESIFNSLIKKENCFYRRYSDDIVVICKKEQMESVSEFVYSEMRKLKVEISKEKTEVFLFKNENRLQVYKLNLRTNLWDYNKPLVYLGFEFYGYQTLIKSGNLSKFYRRMIYAVKRKSRRAHRISEKLIDEEPVLFKNQIRKLYWTQNLNKTTSKRTRKDLVKLDTGEFRVKVLKHSEVMRSNYLSYVRRASEIMEEPAILNQLRNHKKIFNQAVRKHFQKEEVE